VRDIGLGDADDERVAASANEAAAALISRELDFADVRRFPPQTTQGILVLRLPDESRADEISAVLIRFLGSSLVARLPGHLVILEGDRVRFRPALPTE
jgi:predicted nuclease of predicted toxin-antitoxin system